MKQCGSYRRAACQLILALQDGPKTVTGVLDFLGKDTVWRRKGVCQWMKDFEVAGLVRKTERKRPGFGAGQLGPVYEWISE